MQYIKNRISDILTAFGRRFGVDLTYIVRGSFWISIGQVIISITAFGLSIIYANFLSAETLGVYKYVLSVTGIFAIATLTGMPSAMTQSVARGLEGQFIPALKTRIKWGLIGGLASLVAASYYFYRDNSILGTSFLIVAIFVPFMDSFNLYDSILSGRKQFKITSQYFMIAQIVTTAAIVAAIFFTNNIFIILFTYFISWTFFRGLFTFLVVREHKLKTESDPETIKNGLHLSLINIINVIASQIDKVLVFQTIGAGALAIYSIATAPIDQVRNFLARILSTLAFPKYSVKEKNDLKRHVFSWTWRLSLLTVPIMIVYVVAAPYLFSVLFPKYVETVGYSQLYALTLLPSIFFLPQTALYANMAKKQIYYFNLITSLFQIATLFVFGYLMGLAGIVIARILARFMNYIVSLILVRRM